MSLGDVGGTLGNMLSGDTLPDAAASHADAFGNLDLGGLLEGLGDGLPECTEGRGEVCGTLCMDLAGCL